MDEQKKKHRHWYGRGERMLASTFRADRCTEDKSGNIFLRISLWHSSSWPGVQVAAMQSVFTFSVHKNHVASYLYFFFGQAARLWLESDWFYFPASWSHQLFSSRNIPSVYSSSVSKEIARCHALNACRVDGKGIGYGMPLFEQHIRFDGFWVSHKEKRKFTFAQPKFSVANETSEDMREAGGIGMWLGIKFDVFNDQLSAFVTLLLKQVLKRFGSKWGVPFFFSPRIAQLRFIDCSHA